MWLKQNNSAIIFNTHFAVTCLLNYITRVFKTGRISNNVTTSKTSRRYCLHTWLSFDFCVFAKHRISRSLKSAMTTNLDIFYIFSPVHLSLHVVYQSCYSSSNILVVSIARGLISNTNNALPITPNFLTCWFFMTANCIFITRFADCEIKFTSEFRECRREFVECYVHERENIFFPQRAVDLLAIVVLRTFSSRGDCAFIFFRSSTSDI